MITPARKAARPAPKITKKAFTTFTLQEAMALVPAERFVSWKISAMPTTPSMTLSDVLIRLESFDLTGTEAAKLLLIDTVLLDVVPRHPSLKVWKSKPLESDTTTGFRPIRAKTKFLIT